MSLKPYFLIQAIGPQGGTLTKTGRLQVHGYLAYGDNSLKLTATLVNNRPHVRIELLTSDGRLPGGITRSCG